MTQAKGVEQEEEQTEASLATGADNLDAEEDAPAPAGRLTNLLCGLAIAALGAGAFFVALDLGLGSLTRPNSGTWPGIVSLMLVAIGLVVAARAHTFTDAERITKDVLRVAAGVATLAVAAQLYPVIGFEIPSFLLLVFWMTVLGNEKLKISVPTAAGTVIVFYLIFVTGLSVPVPRLF